jgi:NRPS condensation-like uncharacterized protein
MLASELVDAAIFGLMGRYGDLSMHAVVDLRRTFSAAELEAALTATIEAFPVLGHRYAPGLWRDRWVEVQGPVSDSVHVEQVDGGTSALEEATARWVRRPLLATKDRPVRVVALTSGPPLTSMRLVLSVLHIAGDGMAVAALSHVFGSRLRGIPPTIPADPRRDVAHAIDGLRWFHRPRLARSELRIALEPLLDLAHLVAQGPLARPYPTERGANVAWRHVVIGAEPLARARSECSGASVNDLLIATLARAAGARTSGGSVTVLYTMDLRRYASGPRLTTTNTSSVLAVRLRRSAMGDLSEAVGSVQRITKRRMARLDGPAFMLGPHHAARMMPHALLRRLTRLVGPVMIEPALARGLIVTNVGRIDDGLAAFGDDIQRIGFVGPLVERLPVPVIVAFGYRGELHLQLYAGAGIGDRALDELSADIAATFAQRGDQRPET